MLRGRIVRRQRLTFESADRGDEDDRALFALDHMRRDGLHGAPHAREVDVERLLPLLLGHVRDRSQLSPDAGVRDEEVDLAELLDALLDRAVEVGLGAYVALDGDHPTVELVHCRDGAGQVLPPRHRVIRGRYGRRHVQQDQVCALTREPLSKGGAHATAGTRDERNLALYASHVTPFAESSVEWPVTRPDCPRRRAARHR
jgi:hypothetical protein